MLYKMKLGGTTKLFVLLDFFNRTFLFALIAQSVEQRTENPCVAGSIPAQGTSQWYGIYSYKRRNNYEKVKSFNFIQSIDTSNCACFYLWFFPCGEVSFCCAQLVHLYHYCEKFIKNQRENFKNETFNKRTIRKGPKY